jgi:hypothetical protein
VITLSYITISNPYIFSSITAVFIVFAYVMSMITLLTLPQEWRSGQNIQTLIGIVTALAIFCFAAEDLLQALITV